MKRNWLAGFVAMVCVLGGCGGTEPKTAEELIRMKAEAERVAKDNSGQRNGLDFTTVDCSDGEFCIIQCGAGGRCEVVGTETGDIWMCGC